MNAGETLRGIQRMLGECQARIAEIDRSISGSLEIAARCLVDHGTLDVSSVTVLRAERAVAADELRVLVRAAELAHRAARDAESRAKREQFQADPRPLQTHGPYVKPGHKIAPLPD